MDPETILLMIIWLSLTLYILIGGADFGAGIWEVNTALQASEKEKSLSYRAIGPVWEANHVWLIFVMVLLQTTFPPVFAALSRALWLPLFLALVGIIFRGAGYAFRSHSSGVGRQSELWGAMFALASTAAPFFLGAAAGAVASGRLAVTPQGKFTGDYLTGWISPLAIFTGFFTVGVCAYLAAVYLMREAVHEKDVELIQLWRQRALATGAWMGVLSFAGLAFLAVEPTSFWEGFRQRAWPLVGFGVLSGHFSLVALWYKQPTAAVLGAAATVTSVIWGWGLAQYPVLIPPTITVQGAKGPDTVLWAMIVSISIGMLLLLPSLYWLLAIFKKATQHPMEG